MSASFFRPAISRILAVVFVHDGLHLREIARRAGMPESQAKAALDTLVGIGFLRARRQGNMVIFDRDPECKFASELRGLYLKTDGVFGVLSDAFKPLRGIEFAFVFGSLAKSKERAHSDVDVMIIGEPDDDSLSAACLAADDVIGRVVNPVIWTRKELLDRIRDRNGFISEALASHPVFITGDADGLARLIGPALPRTDRARPQKRG